MKTLVTVLLAGVVQLGLMHNAFAETGLEAVQKAGVLKIGTEGTYPPFTFHEASGNLSGFDVEIAQELAARLHVKAAFIESKWDGLIAGLDAKRYDVVVNEVGITPERQKKYDFSQPYIVSKGVLVVGKNNNDIKAFTDLKGKKSAQSLTSNYAQIARKYGAELVATDGFNQAVDLVAQGRADATINDNLSYLDFKKHRPDAPVKVVATENDVQPEAVLLRKENPELLAAINKALADMKADGTYLRISQKYFGTDVSH